jgi:tol-pal system protein YbgF
VLFVCSLLLIPSCLTIQEDILTLERRIVALNSRVNKLEESTEGINVKSIHESQAEVVAELDEIRRELQSLSGSVEDDGHLIKRAIERDTTEQDVVKARLAELEAKIKELQKYLHLEPTAEPKEAGLDKGTKGTTEFKPQPQGLEELTSPENRLYESTLAIYRDGKYEEAIEGFKDFLNSYPNSKLADNAQFWIGESYMSLAEYEKAILAYQEVIKNYPGGNKVPNAMLKQALAFYEIKDATSSKLLLKKIIKKYPDSAEAKIAEAKLKTMK